MAVLKCVSTRKGYAKGDEEQTDNVQSCSLDPKRVGQDINVAVYDLLRPEKFGILVVDVSVAPIITMASLIVAVLGSFLPYLLEITISATSASWMSSNIRSTIAGEQISIEEVLLHTASTSAALLNLFASCGLRPGNEIL